MVPNPAGPQQKKTVVQQDRVEALHDNRNTLEKKVHLSVIDRGRRDPPTKVTCYYFFNAHQRKACRQVKIKQETTALQWVIIIIRFVLRLSYTSVSQRVVESLKISELCRSFVNLDP